MLRGLILFNLILAATDVYAQTAYVITGKVTGENKKPLAGATVFIDGSQTATATDESGYYKLVLSVAGSYLVSVKMIGYSAGSKDIIIKEQSANVDFVLPVKTVVLNQVNIGSDKNWARNFEIFKTQFLGTTPNAITCKITNPEVINFSTRQNMLYADAGEFLIIENPALGYRIKYLLKTFQFDKLGGITAYDGTVVFQELPGTDAQKQDWAKNRQHAYLGSLMHFLRSVFTKTVLKEGFTAGQLYTGNGQQYYDTKPVDFDTLVTAIDTNFITLKFSALHIAYNRDKAAQWLNPGSKDSPIADSVRFRKAAPANTSAVKKTPVQSAPKYVSDLISYAKEVTLDANGRVFSGYLLSFLIRGDWTYKRVADQLPFEYQPPVNSATSP